MPCPVQRLTARGQLVPAIVKWTTGTNLSRLYSRNMAHQFSIGFGRGISEVSICSVPCQDPVAQARGHPYVCHHPIHLHSVLPQCHRKTRASTKQITPKERTRGAGRQVYFPSNALAAGRRMATCHCFGFLCFCLCFLALSLPRVPKKTVYSTKQNATPCVAQCMVLIGFLFLHRTA